MAEIGYNHRVARWHLFVNKRDRKRRLQFANQHAYWTVEDWAHAVYTDEMSVKLYIEYSSEDSIWRKAEEKLKISF